ncbi:MAG: pentapeptide repeat-containing protein [Rivularia sp. (in: Bacteria)]|nr:pentapeptide repeat-containing protein [Rivularia sp. MS3]
MPLNFSHKNLRGYSFVNQDLTKADFSYSDIRGANFTNAVLKDANFHHAIAGVQNLRVIALMAFSFFMAALCGYASGLTGIIASQYLASVYGGSTSIISGVSGVTNHVVGVTAVIIFSLLTLFFIGTIYRGFSADVWFILAGSEAVIIVIIGLISIIIWGYPGLKAAVLGAWGAAGAGLWSLIGVITVALAVFWSAQEPFFGKILKVAAWFLGLFTATFIFSAVFQVSDVALPLTLFLATVVTCVGIYSGFKALAEDNKYALIRTVGINISAIGGTSFRNTDLTNSDLSHAILKNTDFTNANLTRTNFHLAKNIDLSRVKNTILINPAVRDLVVSKQGANKSCKGFNLQGANLENANLNDINLTEADISEATLKNALLERANLTKTQALNTNFEQANLTAACLEAWNIDSTTQLENTICEYVFLLNNQCERRPSSGSFASGEFAKLFQVVLNTVDLIFRNGLDLQGLSAALTKVRNENQGTNIAIQSIENKGDGVVVVRVEVPEDSDKQKIHAEFTQGYQVALQALEAKYQAQLQSKDEQIAIYKQHQADLRNLMQIAAPKHKQQQEKLVILNLHQGDLQNGFSVTLRIAKQGNHPYFESKGKLPPAIELKEYYQKWRIAYRQSLGINSRLDIPDTQITNISQCDYFYESSVSAEKLQQNINSWLNSDIFRPIKEQLLEQLNPTDIVRFILQTEDKQVRRLPLQLWDFFDKYPKTEMALSSPSYKSTEKLLAPEKIRILAILGNSSGINIDKDKELLENLPNAEVVFLVEPQRQQLNDELWTQAWHILFFAGHSSTVSVEKDEKEEGQICINQTDTLTISELKYALTKAIERGLFLAIFNSCDGLGLAADLADLQIPQIIVMREPVPDKVAQEFLKNFLQEYSQGKTLYQSVRGGREKLQGLENEFPCATWLPVICQNPAEIPPLWLE